MIKAVFLDRDGIINKTRDDYVKTIQEFEILPNVAEAIRLLNNKNILVIIISNQSAVNRGLLSIETLNKIHKFLQLELSKTGSKINAIYYCPHKPDEFCNCRKPKPGLIFKAAQELKINLDNSILIGDSQSDIEAAYNAGIKSILMKSDSNLLKVIESILKEDE